jgi:intracellular multiplication protein IcmE
MKHAKIKYQAGAVKSRAVITLFLILAFVAVLASFYAIKRQFSLGSAATLKSTPALQSLPGSPMTTEKYAGLQDEQNQEQVKVAEKNGTSAVPTLVRAIFKPVDEDVGSGDCSVEALREARAAGVKASELRCRGCSAAALRAAGYTASDLRAAGFSAEELKAAGFSADELRAAGYTASDLKAAGYTADEIKNAGYTCKSMAAAGIDETQAMRTGCDAAKYHTDEVKCDVETLKKARTAGVSAKALRERGCLAEALKAAGFTVNELKDAGFSAAELKAAGFTARDLKVAGFSADDLRAAGFDAKDLNDAGFLAAELKDAGLTNGDLTRAGYSDASVYGVGGSGCNIAQLQKDRANGITAKELKDRGCSLAALKAAGFTVNDLKAAGFSAADLKAAGFSAKDLKDAGFSAAELKAAGFSASDLKAAGFSAAELKAAGFSASDLKDAGFSAKDLKDAGFSAKDLKDAGFSAKDLKDAGFATASLKGARFSAKDLKEAGYLDGALQNAGFSVKELADANALLSGEKKGNCDLKTLQDGVKKGISARVFKDQGCSAAALMAAGYTAQQLKDAGFSAAELRAAGFSAKDLKNAGFSAKDLKDAGFGADELKMAGFGAKDLKDAGFTPDQLKAAGFENAPVVETNQVDSGLEQQIAQGLSGADAALTPAERRLQELRAQQESLMSQQQKSQQVMQIKAAMTSQAKSMLGMWAHAQKQGFVVNDAKEDGIAADTPSLVNNSSKDGLIRSGQVIKAGDIEFGVLETSVNSDQKGPVLASIVHGPLKGTRLIGSFVRNDDKVVLKFSTANIPGVSKSVGVNIYAIDQDTARTGMASEVDHHYWLRYGGLFASSFASGIGTALTTSGTQVEGLANTAASSSAGTWSVTTQQLSPFGEVLVALGDVGNQFSTALSPLVNTPPTVYVDSGAGLGLLFMTDFDVPVKGQ